MPVREQDKHINKIQAMLRKKKDKNGKTFPNVSFQEIRNVIKNNFKELNRPTINLQDRQKIVDFIHNNRIKERESQESKPVVQSNSKPVPIEDNHTEVEEVKDNQPAPLAVTEKQQLTAPQQDGLTLKETAALTTEKLAPQEAVAIIQEIASDSTSQYKQMADELLHQLDSKTDSIVKLVKAAPQIEAEMLKRKLQNASRKSVDYDSIVTEHFRQSSTEINNYLSDIADQFGIAI